MVLDLSPQSHPRNCESVRVYREGTEGDPSTLLSGKYQARTHLASFKNEQIEKLTLGGPTEKIQTYKGE